MLHEKIESTNEHLARYRRAFNHGSVWMLLGFPLLIAGAPGALLSKRWGWASLAAGILALIHGFRMKTSCDPGPFYDSLLPGVLTALYAGLGYEAMVLPEKGACPLPSSLEVRVGRRRMR